MWSFILLTAAAAVVEAKISNIGACDHVAPTDGFFDYEQFAEENQGTWIYSKLPRTETFANIKSMYLITRNTTIPSQYYTELHYKTNDSNDYETLVEEDVIDVGNGHAIVTSRGDKPTQFKITFLKYVPGRFAYYYMCSEEGGDEKVDYRFVVMSKVDTLTCDEQKVISNLEYQYKFKGKLRDLNSY